MQRAPVSRGIRRMRLLIVDDMPDMAQNVQKLLHFERDIVVVGVATSGHEAIQKAVALHPDVILMDINLRDMDGLKATEAINAKIATCVVMMSVNSEPEYLTRAMMVGARGYLIKPFTSDDLINTLRTAWRPETTPQQAGDPNLLRKVIAVYSPKGGVGRSVIAANLAVALKREQQDAKQDAKIVLVDANLQSGDAHVLLNVNTSNSIDDLREATSLDPEIIDAAIAHHEGSNIGLLRAPMALESAELFTADAMKLIIEDVRNTVDYLVVDTDTSFSEATLTVLEQADLILLVTTLEVTTINRVSQFFELMDRLGYARAKVRLVCNRVDSLFGIQPKHVETRLHQRFIAQIPEDTRLVVMSVNRGVPFVLSHRNAPISKAMYALAEKVDGIVRNPDGGGGEKRRGLFR
jgi:pilus assembly protein CpaE